MVRSVVDQIDDLLPQTQCTKCGYTCCRDYAEAIAKNDTDINQCPPGGAAGIARLADLLGRPVSPLNPLHGSERQRHIAKIDETLCIGCTLCMQACPVDAVIGAHKQMHTVAAEYCTGCDLCLAPCPVDCIEMVPLANNDTGWMSWAPEQALAARARHDFRRFRLKREREENEARLAARTPTAAHEIKRKVPESDTTAEDRKKAAIQAALAKARQRRE